MKKLSEIIKTDCYIDCGTNEKLREVVSLLESKYKFRRWMPNSQCSKIYSDDAGISIYGHDLEYLPSHKNLDNMKEHHIPEIDLNA